MFELADMGGLLMTWNLMFLSQEGDTLVLDTIMGGMPEGLGTWYTGRPLASSPLSSKENNESGMVAHIFNPSQGYLERTCIKKSKQCKYINISLNINLF